MAPQKLVERLPGTPDQARNVRRLVAAALGDLHPSADDAILLASEITTNAVQHTRSAEVGGGFTVVVEHTDDWVRVTVRDDGAPTPPCTCRRRSSSTNGRGLMLLDSMALRWGLLREPHATEVWFEVTAP